MEKYCMNCMRKIDEQDNVCPYCKEKQGQNVPPHHLQLGTMLSNKYIIGKALGEGGFGITYIGRDTVLDMRVAIKEYFPNGYVNRNNTVSLDISNTGTPNKKDFFEKGKERFLKEARILARFSGQEGIVDVRDFFEANNTAYIVMEYIDGITLKKYLKNNGTLTPEHTLNLMMPIMKSLKKVHEQGLIHRDISPDNIMIINDKVKLLDFGAARDVSAIGNKSISVMLKPGYAPEEQYRSKGQQGAWTDVYAICATMYKCITGITPDDSTQRVYNDELKAPSTLGIVIDPNFEKALLKGLAVLQKDRLQSIDELINGINGKFSKSINEDITVYVGKKVSEDDKETIYEDKPVSEDDKETIYEDKPVSEDDKETIYEDKPVSEDDKETIYEDKTVSEDDKETVYEDSKETKYIKKNDNQKNKEKSSKFSLKSIVKIILIIILVALIIFGIILYIFSKQYIDVRDKSAYNVYGKYVNYTTPEIDENIKWQILYTAENNVYIVSDRNVKKESFAEIVKDNNSNIENENIKKYFKYITRYQNTNNNLSSIKYLLDTNNWKKYSNNKYANYAVGAIPIEMLIKSYNNVHETKLEYVIENNGYRVKFKNENTYSSQINLTDLIYNITEKTQYEDLYNYYDDSTANEVAKAWIAGNSAVGEDMLYSLSNTLNNNESYTSEAGIRPVVELKSDIMFKENKNGTYEIVCNIWTKILNGIRNIKNKFSKEDETENNFLKYELIDGNKDLSGGLNYKVPSTFVYEKNTGYVYDGQYNLSFYITDAYKNYDNLDDFIKDVYCTSTNEYECKSSKIENVTINDHNWKKIEAEKVGVNNMYGNHIKGYYYVTEFNNKWYCVQFTSIFVNDKADWINEFEIIKDSLKF